MRISNIVSVVCILFVLLACRNKFEYSEYQDIRGGVWDMQKAGIFEFEIEDTAKVYNVHVNLRHGGNYPYSNIWIMLHIIAPDGSIQKKRMEYTLAYPEGAWTGSGLGDIIDNRFVLEHKKKFGLRGKYKYMIYQDMRMNKLPGVYQVGLDLIRLF
jgi:gliding motility-associated lipoprotein GldH